MILSRWDRPGQSAQGAVPVSPTQAWLAAIEYSSDMRRAAEHKRASVVLPYDGHRVSQVHYDGPHHWQTYSLSDATPIARGNTPLIIPILTVAAHLGTFVMLALERFFRLASW
jgi:hypothetical protein